MNDSSLVNSFNALSPQLQASVVAYMNKLLSEEKSARRQKKGKPKLPRKAGFLRGTFRIKKGFDDPIEDFKDYME